MDTHRAGDRQAVYEDLVATLQEVRGGAHADAVAQALFRHTASGMDPDGTGPSGTGAGATELVALVDDGECAVCYDGDTGVMERIPLTRHGLARSATEREWGWLADPAAWVDATDGDALVWVHPRYRWVQSEQCASWVVVRP